MFIIDSYTSKSRLKMITNPDWLKPKEKPYFHQISLNCIEKLVKCIERFNKGEIDADTSCQIEKQILTDDTLSMIMQWCSLPGACDSYLLPRHPPSHPPAKSHQLPTLRWPDTARHRRYPLVCRSALAAACR